MINLKGDHSTGILECLDISITITFKYRPLPFYLLVNRKPEPVKLFHSNKYITNRTPKHGGTGMDYRCSFEHKIRNILRG